MRQVFKSIESVVYPYLENFERVNVSRLATQHLEFNYMVIAGEKNSGAA